MKKYIAPYEIGYLRAQKDAFANIDVLKNIRQKLLSYPCLDDDIPESCQQLLSCVESIKTCEQTCFILKALNQTSMLTIDIGEGVRKPDPILDALVDVVINYTGGSSTIYEAWIESYSDNLHQKAKQSGLDNYQTKILIGKVILKTGLIELLDSRSELADYAYFARKDAISEMGGYL
ncbi:hypothetical protein O4H49_19965 [Kiloniella laminariae]|uniref:Uncharacterized protein n=1 Tax=Kiloniella laminariae TaxID=454162 RepID=A0ABT4LPW2_9PROT|nr:hypothetical protein [Kiloniella laminariae]MCZ4283071.1 hypothetical protein [Kiloniella laminariae]